MPNETEQLSESHESEPRPNPAQFYIDQANQLDGQPALQKLVRERATALLGAESWGSEPEDMRQGMQEVIKFLRRGLDEPLSPNGMPTLIDVSETRTKDQELGAELIALLQGDPTVFSEGMPQPGPVILGERGNSYVESKLPIALPGWQLIRSRYLRQIPGKEDSARYKFYLEAVAPTN
jgi:hypothetical protein